MLWTEARDDLACYGWAAHNLQPARHHLVWIDRIHALLAGTGPRKLLIVAPPGTAKSTWLSLLFPPWYLGRHPDHSVLFFTSSDTMARQFGGTVKSTLEDNPVHALVFPDAACRPDTDRGWSTDGLYLAGTPTGSKDPAYRALGYGASAIGARAHGVILDDPLTQEQARSPVEQEKAKRYHDMTVDSRLHPDGWALAIMTRWHDLDLAAHLAAKSEWATLTMPALDEDGRALWPERFPASWLEAKRREIGGPLFQAIYQADPTGLGGEVFKAAAWFRPLPDGFDRRTLTRVVQFWDLAFSEKDTADYTVGLTLGRDRDGNLYVLGLYRERVGQAQLLNAIASQVHLHRPAVVGVEEAAYRAPATRDVVGRLLRGGLPAHVQAVKPVGDKVLRARLPAGRAEAGMLYCDRGAPWAETFIAELMGFPHGAHDDQCLVGETEVTTPDGPRRLDAVRAGDTVLGASGWVRVEAARATGLEPVVANGPLRGTADHPVWADGAWRPLSLIQPTMSVWIQDAPSPAASDPARRNRSASCTTSGSTRASRWDHQPPSAIPHARLVSWRDARIPPRPSGSARCAASMPPARSGTATHWSSTRPSAAASASRRSSSTAWPSDATPTAGRPVTASTSSPVDSTSSGASRRSTRKSGSTTTAPSPTVSTSTTKTATRPTTASTTSAYAAASSTRPSTPTTVERTAGRTFSRPASPLPATRPLPGTAHPRAERGTASTPASNRPLERVYNLATTDGTYFANGVLVHNCDALSGACQLALEWRAPREPVPVVFGGR